MVLFEIGKTLIFCVSQKHAAKVTQILNVLADRAFPNQYNSDFAVQVTSSVQNSQSMRGWSRQRSSQSTSGMLMIQSSVHFTPNTECMKR